jgi:hypothetical protein
MSKPVTESALASVWPGSGVPNSIQSRIIHGANTARATAAGTPTIATFRRPGIPAWAQTTTSQAKPRKTASFRVRAASPISSPSPSRPSARRRSSPSAAALRRIRGIRAQADRARTANGIVESGSAECSTSGR